MDILQFIIMVAMVVVVLFCGVVLYVIGKKLDK